MILMIRETTMTKQYDPAVKENLEKNGLPPKNLFDKYMQQFTYRYLVKFGKWDESEKIWKEYGEEETTPELDSLEESAAAKAPSSR